MASSGPLVPQTPMPSGLLRASLAAVSSEWIVALTQAITCFVGAPRSSITHTHTQTQNYTAHTQYTHTQHTHNTHTLHIHIKPLPVVR